MTAGWKIVYVPCPVEDGNEFILFFIAGLLMFADFPSKGICRTPLIAVDGLTRNGNRIAAKNNSECYFIQKTHRTGFARLVN